MAEGEGNVPLANSRWSMKRYIRILSDVSKRSHNLNNAEICDISEGGTVHWPQQLNETLSLEP